ncbi:hypothetical protein WKW77_12565 [Variovorax ureilyticus]|uniref:Gasdermin bGSDM n=1 Tax=Variovorax ureilyticus TaxID=1836198 RepID=A0ABU8VE15_9BURK
MADALVKALNRLGYQPVFLPRSGVKPPEVYHYLRDDARLVRIGELVNFLPAAAGLAPTEGKLGDINYSYTSGKKVDAAVSFLEQALKCIGIDAVPKIDLGFTGAKEFSFAFTDVHYLSVDPARLLSLIKDFSTDGIPHEYVEDGRLHLAYEYAYARELVMARGDRQAFDHDISGKVGAYFDVGTKGSVSVASATTISFKNANDTSVAFAYKAGQLMREKGKWVLYPEEVDRNNLLEERRPFVPQRAIVLSVE